MRRKLCPAAAYTTALFNDDRLGSHPIHLIDHFPGVLIRAFQSLRGDSQTSAALNLTQELDRRWSQKRLAIAAYVDLELDFDHARIRGMILLFSDHDFRRFDDGVRVVTYLEPKVIDCLAGNDRCDDVPVSEVDLHFCSNQSLFNENNLSLQFVSSTQLHSSTLVDVIENSVIGIPLPRNIGKWSAKFKYGGVLCRIL